MNNGEFLASVGCQGEEYDQCLEAMAKYGENHWWEPDVPGPIFAYHQYYEPVYLDHSGTMGRFGRGIERLLGRPVTKAEVALRTIDQELEQAWTAWRLLHSLDEKEE